jgi:hypothetical protein
MLSSRHITFYGFFAVLYYLLIMNWSFASTPDYKIFTDNLEASAKKRRMNSDHLIDLYKEKVKKPGFKDRIAPYISNMLLVRNSTDSVIKYLEQLKTELHYLSVSKTSPGKVRAFIRSHRFDTLGTRLDAYLERLMDLSLSTRFNANLKKHGILHWNKEMHFNENNPDALISILSAFEDDINDYEYKTINELYIGGADVGGNEFGSYLTSIAFPSPGFVLPGQKTKITAMLAAYNRSVNPTFSTNSGRITNVEYGLATWVKQNSPLGLNTIEGKVSFEPDSIHTYPFSFPYFVAAPGIALNINNGNLCYVGVPNPISISVPGFDKDKLSLKVKDAKVTQTAPGKFNIFFYKAPKGDTYAFVEGTNKEGTTSTVGSLPLKITYLPSPIATIAGDNDGYIHLGQFRNADRITMISQETDFDMSYTILSYKLSLMHDKNQVYIEPVKGKGRFSKNPGIMKIMDIARRGDKAIFEEITAKDANGRLIELAPMILKLY